MDMVEKIQRPNLMSWLHVFKSDQYEIEKMAKINETTAIHKFLFLNARLESES